MRYIIRKIHGSLSVPRNSKPNLSSNNDAKNLYHELISSFPKNQHSKNGDQNITSITNNSMIRTEGKPYNLIKDQFKLSQSKNFIPKSIKYGIDWN